MAGAPRRAGRSGRPSLGACTKGVSALEFALFAPILCLGLLAMIDVGMSVALRMDLDRSVRSGAQAAITLDNPAPEIAAIIRISAGEPEDLHVDVDQTCFCRVEQALVATTCGLFCSTGEEPSVFFAITATRPYSGAIFGERTIASDTRVQVR
jgi:pilus assembly protein CpaE